MLVALSPLILVLFPRPTTRRVRDRRGSTHAFAALFNNLAGGLRKLGRASGEKPNGSSMDSSVRADVLGVRRELVQDRHRGWWTSVPCREIDLVTSAAIFETRRRAARRRTVLLRSKQRLHVERAVIPVPVADTTWKEKLALGPCKIDAVDVIKAGATDIVRDWVVLQRRVVRRCYCRR